MSIKFIVTATNCLPLDSFDDLTRSHDCTLFFSLFHSEATRTWTCHDVAVRGQGPRVRAQGQRQNLGRRLSDVLTCTTEPCLAPRRPCNTADYATCCVTSAAAANGGGALRQRAPRRPLPPTNQGHVPFRVYTQRHVAGVLWPCEPQPERHQHCGVLCPK